MAEVEARTRTAERRRVLRMGMNRALIVYCIRARFRVTVRGYGWQTGQTLDWPQTHLRYLCFETADMPESCLQVCLEAIADRRGRWCLHCREAVSRLAKSLRAPLACRSMSLPCARSALRTSPSWRLARWPLAESSCSTSARPAR